MWQPAGLPSDIQCTAPYCPTPILPNVLHCTAPPPYPVTHQMVVLHRRSVVVQDGQAVAGADEEVVVNALVLVVVDDLKQKEMSRHLGLGLGFGRDDRGRMNWQ